MYLYFIILILFQGGFVSNKKIFNSVMIIFLIISFFIGRITENKKICSINKNTSKIAKWVFEVNGGEEDVKEVSILKPDNNIVEDNKIAPGSKGNFQICINSKESEVKIKYQIKFENEKNKPRNLKYRFDGKFVDNIKEIEPLLTGNLDSKDYQKQYIIEWEWINKSENPNHDIIDTEDGQKLDEYTFDIIVIGEKI